ncbi:2Fe-2S iron-sulfur cluster binding domain protein [Candidatus Blochmanniella vafra str. BVAF]|uniref:2Fe-2S iron-sulfur cluster binding domain protein n=1 Tax=Blochmanniella vafra (strain BVAF) TaxID=859654 RepID=E8Q743_BLOVB|nr:class I ribonucleotide reductase maintenance protein YfaE [Candidatus Blochmannia vafer]ADV33867.1 2Fe-2S iron-sulfur cluster binding domain protein [Candidatus Blochmannia vafer str. BVAF]
MNLIIFNYKIIIINAHISHNIHFIYNNIRFQSLLEALEYHKIPTNYQCRSGYCGSCRVNLIQGQIKYHSQPLASSFSSKEIFICSCFPEQDIIIKI